jgi:hypothetical protein
MRGLNLSAGFDLPAGTPHLVRLTILSLILRYWYRAVRSLPQTTPKAIPLFPLFQALLTLGHYPQPHPLASQVQEMVYHRSLQHLSAIDPPMNFSMKV